VAACSGAVAEVVQPVATTIELSVDAPRNHQFDQTYHNLYDEPSRARRFWEILKAL
jgi:hypothetical protein